MKISFAILFALTVSISQTTLANSSKEREIRWAWQHLGKFVNSCLQSQECTEHKETVEKLKNYLPQTTMPDDSNWGKLLKFVSEAKNPEIFKSGSEEHRLAVTFEKPFSEVYINTDRMNIPLRDWIGLLTHETLHHLGLKDDEKRLPDAIGASVALHFQKNSNSTDLAEYNHPEIILTYFNPQYDEIPPVLWELGKLAIYNNFGPNSANPICKNGGKVVKQTLRPPLWRLTKFQPHKGVFAVRTTEIVVSKCLKETGETYLRTDSMVARLGFRFPGPFDPNSDWWNLPSRVDLTYTALGSTDSPREFMYLNRTYLIKSIRHSEKNLNPGGQWDVNITIASLDNHKPSTCEIYFSGSRWTFLTDMDIPAFEIFNSCTIKQKGPNEWEISGSYTLPEHVQPDSFYISMLRLSNNNVDRYAFPAKPQVVTISNPRAPRALTPDTWKVSGDVKPLKEFKGRPVRDSFAVKRDSSFQLEIEFKGHQKVTLEMIHLDVLQVIDGGIVFRSWMTTLDMPKEFFKKIEHIPTPDGFKIRITAAVPSSLPNFAGFRLTGLYINTDDLHWAEVEFPLANQGYLVIDSFVQ